MYVHLQPVLVVLLIAKYKYKKKYSTKKDEKHTRIEVGEKRWENEWAKKK